VVRNVNDAAATKGKYNCLICGKPREHLAGMMITKRPGSARSDDGNPPKKQKKFPDPELYKERKPKNATPQNVVQFLTSV
jgi:hypothetical protein